MQNSSIILSYLFVHGNIRATTAYAPKPDGVFTVTGLFEVGSNCDIRDDIHLILLNQTVIQPGGTIEIHYGPIVENYGTFNFESNRIYSLRTTYINRGDWIMNGAGISLDPLTHSTLGSHFYNYGNLYGRSSTTAVLDVFAHNHGNVYVETGLLQFGFTLASTDFSYSTGVYHVETDATLELSTTFYEESCIIEGDGNIVFVQYYPSLFYGFYNITGSTRIRGSHSGGHIEFMGHYPQSTLATYPDVPIHNTTARVVTLGQLLHVTTARLNLSTHEIHIPEILVDGTNGRFAHVRQVTSDQVTMTANGNLEGLDGTLVIFDSFTASTGNIVDLHVILAVNCTGTLTNSRFDLYRSQFEVQGYMDMRTNNIYFHQDSQFLISSTGTFKSGQSSGVTTYHPHSTHHHYPGFVVYGTYVHERTQAVHRYVVMVLHPGAFYHSIAGSGNDIWYHRTFDYGADILLDSLLWNRCGQNTVADEFHKYGGNLNISSTGELVCRITVSHIYANVYVEEGGQINTFDSPSRTYIHQLDPVNGNLGLVRYCNQLYLYGGGYAHALVSAGRPGTGCNTAAYHLGGDPRGLVVLGGMTWHRRSITFDSVDSSIIVNGHLQIQGTEANQVLTLNRGKLIVNGTGQYLRNEALRINHEGSLEISPVGEFVSTGTTGNNFIYSSSTVVGTIVNFGTYFDSFSSNIHTYSVDIHNYGTFVRDGVSSYSRIMPGNFTNYPTGTLVVRGNLYFYTATSFHGQLLLENGQLRLYGSPHIFHWDSEISATDGHLACYNSDSWFYGVLNQTFGGTGIRLVHSSSVVYWRAHQSILGTGTVLVSTGTVYVNTTMIGIPHFDVSGGTVEYLISEPIIRLGTLTSGLITAGSSVFISGYFRINQGTFYSFENIYVMDGATLDVDSVNSCTLSEVTVINDGRVLYTSGSFLPSHSLVVNHNLLETVASIRSFSVPINNFGVINQSDPMSVTDLSGRVTNYNLLNSAFGILKLTGGLTNFGTINVAETGTLDFADGMSSFFDGTLLSGNGDVVFTGGYIDVLSPPF
ncbi:hypothetical protein GEMRC1_012752 [Eukaryota sp. GEM-RC1]